MWYGLISVLIIFTVIIIGFSGYSLAKNNSSLENSSLNNDGSRTQLEDKLLKLSDNPVIAERSVGAMCYKVSVSPHRIEYICPVCREMTLYPAQYNMDIDRISYYRILVKKI